MDTGQRRLGSSPLTRGKPSAAWLARPAAGLIPAHAGKTRWSCCAALGHGAHPRSRGENSVFWRLVSVISGSSPLTRGKRGEVLARLDTGRLIPAHAGKTRRSTPLPMAMTAHPRSRGENMVVCDRSGQSVGSSPLTRGKRKVPLAALPHSGLIPAHAGKTRSADVAERTGPAHPRSRGENGGRVAGLRGVRGSSPLTRGKPVERWEIAD